MILKIFVTLLAFSFSTIVQTPSCNRFDGKKQDEVKEFFNVNSKVELAFFYTKESTYEQRKYFDENILMRNTDRGQYMREGVKGTFGLDQNGYEGVAVKFDPVSTKEQRDEIKKRLKESPIVHKIYENVVPSEIKDLDGPKNEVREIFNINRNGKE